MNTDFKINIFNEVNGVAAVSSIDGKTVCEKIKAAITNKKHVILDFFNIEFITSAFLNTAIGSLFKDFSDSTIDTIELINISESDKKLYFQVKERAKEYYRNPDYREKLIEALKEEIIEDGNN